jgi:hypothetical protein
VREEAHYALKGAEEQLLTAGLGRTAAPNKGLELTASSVRSSLAPASGSSSGLALGGQR